MKKKKGGLEITIEKKINSAIQDLSKRDPFSLEKEGKVPMLVLLSNLFIDPNKETSLFNEKAWNNLKRSLKNFPNNTIIIMGGLIPPWRFYYSKYNFRERVREKPEDSFFYASKFFHNLPTKKVYYILNPFDVRNMVELYSEAIDFFSRTMATARRIMEFFDSKLKKVKKNLDREYSNIESKIKEEGKLPQTKRKLTLKQKKLEKERDSRKKEELEKEIEEIKKELERKEREYKEELSASRLEKLENMLEKTRYSRRLAEKLTELEERIDATKKKAPIKEVKEIIEKAIALEEIKKAVKIFTDYSFRSLYSEVALKFGEEISNILKRIEEKLEILKKEFRFREDIITKRAIPLNLRNILADYIYDYYKKTIYESVGKILNKQNIEFEIIDEKKAIIEIGGRKIGLLGAFDYYSIKPKKNSPDLLRRYTTRKNLRENIEAFNNLEKEETRKKLEKEFIKRKFIINGEIKEITQVVDYLIFGYYLYPVIAPTRVTKEKDIHLVLLGPFFDKRKNKEKGMHIRLVEKSFLSSECSPGTLFISLTKNPKAVFFNLDQLSKLETLKSDKKWIKVYYQGDEHEGKANVNLEARTGNSLISLDLVKKENLDGKFYGGDIIQALNYAGSWSEGIQMLANVGEQLERWMDKELSIIVRLALSSKLKPAVILFPGNHEKKYLETVGFTLTQMISSFVNRMLKYKKIKGKSTIGEFISSMTLEERILKEEGLGKVDVVEVIKVGHASYGEPELSYEGQSLGKLLCVHKMGRGGRYKEDPSRRAVWFLSERGFFGPLKTIYVSHSHVPMAAWPFGIPLVSNGSTEYVSSKAKEEYKTDSPYGIEQPFSRLTTASMLLYYSKNPNMPPVIQIITRKTLEECGKAIEPLIEKRIKKLPTEILRRFVGI